MADLVGTDIPTGDEVKWYYGGAAATHIINRDYTINGASLTKCSILFGNTAEYGLVWAEVTRSSTTFAIPVVELSGGATTVFATPTSQTKGVKIPGQVASGDTVSIKYINVSTTALTHLASCRDVKLSRSIDSKTISVQGQQNKLKKTSTADLTADLSEVTYSQTFLAALYGDEMSATATTQGKKWSDITSGVHKLSCLIGKRVVSGIVVKKWGLMGVQPSNLTENFPTEDYYTRDLSLTVDNALIWDNE